MKIYVAGPYTKGDVVENVRAAVIAGDEIFKKGHIAFIPHLTHLWHMIRPHPWEDWLRMDLEWLKVCDALLRIPGDSPGADRELDEALALGLVVYYDIDAISNKV